MKHLPSATLSWLFPLAAAVAAAACTGSEVGNPSVALTAWTTDEGTARVGAPQGGAGIDGAWVFLEDVQFVPVDHPDPDVVLAGPRAVALVDGSAALEFEPTVGEYGEVRLHLMSAPDAPEGAPAELGGNTFMVTGRLPGGTAFRIAGPSPRGVQLVPERGTALHVEETRDFLLAFDLGAWFAPILADLVGLPVPAEGVVVVDPDHHPEVLARFGDAIATAVSLHGDDNGNGTVDPAEVTPVAGPNP